jgi:hypothetical protein
VAISAASVALGVKKTIEVRRTHRQETRSGEDVHIRARAFADYLRMSGSPAYLVDRLDDEIRLHAQHVTTQADFESALSECLTEFRRWNRDPRDDDSGVRRGRR